MLICGLPKRIGDDWELARRECNELHAHLGGDRRAAYIATTAYAWFCQRTTSNMDVRANHQAAQERVEAHLRNPAAPFDVPTDDIICQYGKSARENIGNPIWMRL